MTLLLLVLLLLATAGTPDAAGPPQALLVAGAPSPLGLPFSAFPAVAADEQGRAVVLGTSTGAFRRTGAGVTHQVAAGDVLASGRVVAGVGAAVAADGGCAVVRAAFAGGGGGVVRRCPAGVDVLLETGAPAPGGGTVVALVGTVAASGAHVAVGALLDDGRTALLRLSDGAATRIATTGDTAPSGGTMVALRLVGVTADGRVGARASVSGGRDALVAGDGTALRTVALEGDAAGGLGQGGTLTTLAGASLNAAGVWAFRAALGTEAGALAGVFRVDGSAPRVVRPLALEGGLTTEPGVTFRGFPSSLVPSINAAGVVAFRATLSGADGGSAVYTVSADGALTRVVGSRECTPAGSLLRFRDPVVADDGSLCVPASTAGGGPALFVARDGVVAARPLAQVGDRTDIDPGQERFRFLAPSVGARAEDAVFLGSREGIFRVGTDGQVEMLAFVGGPTPLGGTYAVLDAPAAGSGAVAFTAEIRGGRKVGPKKDQAASPALVRAGVRGGPRALAFAGRRGPGRGKFVDFFASTLDGFGRAAFGVRDDVVFEATMEGGRFSRGVFAHAGAGIRLVAGTGARAAGGGTYQAFGSPAVVRGRRVAFVAEIDTGEGRATALVLQHGRRSQRLATRGEAVGGRLAGRIDALEAPDASSTLVAWRATLVEQAREGLFARGARGGSTGLLVATGDAAPGGGAFRGFERPLATDAGVAFVGRLQGSIAPPALYLVRGTTPPPVDAAPPVVERLLGAGSASPLGGSVQSIVAVDANRAGTIIAAVDLVGASAPAAVLALPTVP